MEHNTMLKVFLVLLNLCLVFSNPVKDAATDTCTKTCAATTDGKINVHLIPHSHDDVGWLKTYDQYYEGTGDFNNYENAGVKYILDSTIQALKENPDRRFIQVETAFFWKWWNDQTSETRALVKEMVTKGQLEMINGAWSMNDEAAAHYHSIIDQYTWGFRILEDTVGECGRPKIGWQIDPFGHSREHASIMKQLGFDGLVVGRIDYRDKLKRIEDKNLDFIWNSNDNFAEGDAKIFTTMFPDFYVDETGFCFDVQCSDEEISDANVKDKVTAFTAAVLDKYKDYYKTKNIMLPMGRDFSYQNAAKNFGSLDKLIKGFADHETYNVFYSTPSCYINSVKEEVDKNKIELTVKTDDFFPYASDTHSFWTGYFTSRPTSKRFERVGNNILQSVKQLTTFSRTKGSNDDDHILKLRMAMGVMQHHDAITGTEKQAVADDYSFMLAGAIAEAENPVSNIIRDLLRKNEDVSVDLKLSSCLLTNVSVCDTTRKEQFIVTIHNPLSKVVSHYIRLPVDGENYKITGPDGEEDYDIFDTMNNFDFITESEKATKELVFLANDIPALGVQFYYIETVDGTPDHYHKFADITDDDVSFGIEDQNGFTLDADRKLDTVTIKGLKQNIKQDFYYYNGFTSTSADADHRSSGAYIFRPEGVEVQVAKDLTKKQFAKGNLVDEVLQVFSDEVTQIIRVYKGSDDAYVEFDWLVGNLQTSTKGKEIITRFSVADFENNEIFYTDANGRQQVKRRRNQRSDYNYEFSEEPIASNYYPVTSKIVIKDETQKLEVAVLNDRAQGGSSLKEGVIELMVHRREKADDKFGVNEVLNEQQYGKGLYVRGQHYLTFGVQADDQQSPVVFERDLAHRKLLAPWVLVGDATVEELSNLTKVQDLLNFKFEALKAALPDNVQILTLEPWKDSYILRLEHIFEKDEDTEMSADVTVDLANLFTSFNIVELNPMTLGANEALETETEAETKTETAAMNSFKKMAKLVLNDHKDLDDPATAMQHLTKVKSALVAPKLRDRRSVLNVNKGSDDTKQAVKQLITKLTSTEGAPKLLENKVKLDASKKSGEPVKNLQSLLTIFKSTKADPDLKVTLKPMEIKTFIFKTDKENTGGKANGITDNNDNNDNNSSQALGSAFTLVIFMLSFYILF